MCHNFTLGLADATTSYSNRTIETSIKNCLASTVGISWKDLLETVNPKHRKFKQGTRDGESRLNP